MTQNQTNTEATLQAAVRILRNAPAERFKMRAGEVKEHLDHYLPVVRKEGGATSEAFAQLAGLRMALNYYLGGKPGPLKIVMEEWIGE
jgi:hypothetical protein